MAASKKDMRRPDLIVPFIDPGKDKKDIDFSSTFSSSLPMVAIFTRNKYIAWYAFISSLQSWLGETEDQKKSQVQPGYFSVGMAVMAIVMSYLPLFLPPTPVPAMGFGAGKESASPAPSS